MKKAAILHIRLDIGDIDDEVLVCDLYPSPNLGKRLFGHRLPCSGQTYSGLRLEFSDCRYLHVDIRIIFIIRRSLHHLSIHMT